MKNNLQLIAIIILLIAQTTIYAQSDVLKKKEINSSVELSVIKNNESELTSGEYTYILKMVNKLNKEIEIKVIADNVNCNNKSNISFTQKVYLLGSESNASNISQNIKIKAKETIEFYVKLINSTGIKSNNWNCTEVKAIGIDTKIISNIISLESFVPNPKDFR